MSRQNVYDDPEFFEGYRKIRDNPANANIHIEGPALFSLVPPLEGARVLDLGCGAGGHCRHFADRGARRVVGLDLSHKMLEVARRENPHPAIEYRLGAMEDLGESEAFDVVVSSLALHYVDDYRDLVARVYRALTPGGWFVFSQEHPLNTCFSTGSRWTRDAAGEVLHANVANYTVDGARESTWFIGVTKYHRTFSTVVNGLAEAGFVVDRLVEPLPSAEVMDHYPEYQKDVHKPDFLLVRARRPLQEPLR